MAAKKIEAYTTEELKKYYRTLKVVFRIEAAIAGLLLVLVLVSLATKKFTLNPALNFMPLMFIGVMIGPWVSMNNFKKELQKRGETV